MLEILSQTWSAIQGTLFPWLDEQLGPTTEKQKKLIAILEVVRIEEFIASQFGEVGRPRKTRGQLARAFVAKAVYNLPTTRSLIECLQAEPALRRICGWDFPWEIPGESTFSRAFAEFANSELPVRAHNALIVKFYAGSIVEHTSRDSTPIEGREKPVKKSKKKAKPKKRGRPKKGEEPESEPRRIEKQLSMPLESMLADLPKACDVGCKKNAKGYMEIWIGYKLHIDTADGDIPLNFILTSASVHDSQVAIPLATETSSLVSSMYDLMDSAYDVPEVIDHSKSLGHVPIVDVNPRRNAELKQQLEDERKACKALGLEFPEKRRYKKRSSINHI